MNTEDLSRWTAEKILSNARDVYKHVVKDSEKRKREKTDDVKYKEEVKEKFQDFAYCYPALFFKIVEDGEAFEFNQLITMLQLMNKVNNDEIAKDDADKYVGQEMVDKYVKPKI